VWNRVYRFLVFGLLAAALLLPSLYGFVSLRQNGGSSCGMSCCKKSKGSSCHHSKDAGHHGGPTWTGYPACSKDCGQNPGLSGLSAANLSPATVDTAFAAPRTILWNRAGFSCERVKAEFALFQRPPPFLSEFHG
jgi:hypothetical protein